MKHFFIIILSIFCFCVCNAHAEGDSTSVPVNYETKTVTPVKADRKTFDSFKKNKDYNYYENKIEAGESWRDKLAMLFIRWLNNLFQVKVTPKQANVTLGIIAIVVLVLLLVLLIVFKPSLFYIGKRKKKIAVDVEEETIHGLQFKDLIKRSLDAGNYSEAIRWKYLEVLKTMQDRELISWNVNKTVNEYVRELQRKDLVPDFRSLSYLFLYFRYGNFEASRSHFDEVEILSNRIIKQV